MAAIDPTKVDTIGEVVEAYEQNDGLTCVIEIYLEDKDTKEKLKTVCRTPLLFAIDATKQDVIDNSRASLAFYFPKTEPTKVDRLDLVGTKI